MNDLDRKIAALQGWQVRMRCIRCGSLAWFRPVVVGDITAHEPNGGNCGHDAWEPARDVDNQGDAQVVEPLALPPPEQGKG